ncbi:MAG: protease modulator HflC [Planctomycetota bacterium]
MRTTLAWGALLVAGVGAWACTFTVPEGEVAIVARFGDPRRLVERAGLHFKWPAPVDAVYPVDMRRHVLDPPIAEFLTLDQKNVEVDAFVAWRVTDPRTFLTSLRSRRGADDRIGQVLQSTLRDVLRRGPFEDLVSVEERPRTLEDVREELKSGVATSCSENGFGIAIELVGIERITFPEVNKASVENSMKVKREGIAAQYRAEGDERKAEIEQAARDEEAKLLAEAEERAREIVGQGEAEAIAIERDAIEANPELYFQLQLLDIAESALRGARIILPANHDLAKVFDLVTAPAATEPSGGGEE